jgi:protein-S-isoprenylcysteine O-methyltransferase Ste14
MAYIITGSIAFALIAIYDWAQVRELTWLKPLFLLSAVALCIGTIGILSVPTEFKFAIWLRFFTWIGLVIFLLLLIYSILIEIPIKIKHSEHESGSNRFLVDTGTYALSRHPGVLWFGGAAACMILLHPSVLTLSAGITWTAMDVLLVWVEDQYFFPRIFTGYSEYQKTTPFLWPTRSSLRQCLATRKTDAESENTSFDVHYER